VRADSPPVGGEASLRGSARRFSQSQLIEVNAHSLFSKWFSESGKLVTALFARIREAVEEPDTLVFVLVDEVLHHSLPPALSDSPHLWDPSDSRRFVLSSRDP